MRTRELPIRWLACCLSAVSLTACAPGPKQPQTHSNEVTYEQAAAPEATASPDTRTANVSVAG